MKKIIFLEGLPGVGKTTLLNIIKNKNLDNVYFVDEIINPKILKEGILTEEEFILNEEQKLNLYNDGTIIIDRGPISSISYSQTKKIINPNFDLKKAEIWFFNKLEFLRKSKVVYLTNNQTNFTITSNDVSSPYSSVENQKLLESISIFNIKKYCVNYVIKNYFKTNIDEVIDEVIN